MESLIAGPPIPPLFNYHSIIVENHYCLALSFGDSPDEDVSPLLLGWWLSKSLLNFRECHPLLDPIKIRLRHSLSRRQHRQHADNHDDGERQ